MLPEIFDGSLLAFGFSPIFTRFRPPLSAVTLVKLVSSQLATFPQTTPSVFSSIRRLTATIDARRAASHRLCSSPQTPDATCFRSVHYHALPPHQPSCNGSRSTLLEHRLQLQHLPSTYFLSLSQFRILPLRSENGQSPKTLNHNRQPRPADDLARKLVRHTRHPHISTHSHRFQATIQLLRWSCYSRKT